GGGLMGGLLVGLVARLDPMKDHATFLDGAEQLVADGFRGHFLLVGEGLEADGAFLGAQLRRRPALAGRVHGLGRRDDMTAINSALDLAVSTSIGEGFSNTIGEAMACETPVVATDVGDAALIIGATGRLIPPGDPAALARTVAELAALEPAARQDLGRQARERMRSRFSLDRIMDDHGRFWEDMVGGDMMP
ncbi:MAG: glycosyltransferase, partial [Magnetococcales bacterium]|nr:glycosyltransferase [Magnetococcales bacterium]